MGDTGKDWLEAVLMKKSYEESPIKVVDIKTSDTSGVVTKGENYMSKIRRINAKVMLGSGKVKSMSFIVKNQHETEAMKKLSTDFGVFQREIAMYRDILVKMEGLLEDIDDCDGPFWPKCYDVRLYDRLIFEDLGVSGYAMVDRKNQQGLDSALLVLRHLAKFHGLARILLDREEIPREPFGKSLYRITEQLSTSFTNGNVRSFAEMMETQWGDDWKDAVARLRQIDNIGDKYITSLEAQPEEFKTLCHGDCWTNNIMFKGDPEHPTSMKQPSSSNFVMDGEKDWLEGILKRKAYEESPIKVLEVTEGGTGLGKGENYLSKIQKTKAKVLLGSGRTKNMSFLVKCEHETKHMKKMSVEGGVFVKEITMYRDVLPKMQDLLEEINDPDGIFWAQCYDIRLYDRLVFEDLGVSGFRMVDRLKQLSLPAALMAVKYFAKFHALSKILLDRGEIPMAIFGKNPWVTDDDGVKMMEMHVKNNVEKMSKKMESWGDEWKEAAERLKEFNLSSHYLESIKSSSDEFNCICHFDAWTNNMMFKGEDLENPTSFRLIDFQICTLNSPAKDITQLLLTSVRPEDRRQHTDVILQTYANTLTSCLEKLGYEGAIPTMADLQKAIDRKGPVTLGDAIGFVPIVLGASEHAPDFEELMKQLDEAKANGMESSFDSYNVHENLTPVAVDVIKYQLKEAMDSGLI